MTKNSQFQRPQPPSMALNISYMNQVWHMSSAVMPTQVPWPLIPFIQSEILNRQTGFMTGWQHYVSFQPEDMSHRDRDIFWEEGTTLCRYSKQAKGVPVLLIPSLINKSYIMDLRAQHSFFQSLLDADLSPYLIEWGEPGDEEKNFDIADYIIKRIIPLAQKIKKETGYYPIGLGYCMGGLLLAGALAQKDLLFSGAVFIASPWDFHTDQDATTQKANMFFKTIEPIMKARGHLDVDLIQAFFTTLNPMQAARKFIKFNAEIEDKEKASAFVAIEDWIQNGVPLSEKIASECFISFYAQNATHKGNWKCGDALVDPSKFNLPSLVVTAGRDTLVPPQSSESLLKALKDPAHILCDTGHIGLMGSKRQTNKVWPQIFDWIKSLENSR